MNRKIKDGLQYVLIHSAAIICVITLFSILFYILKNGIDYISLDFIFSTYSATNHGGGISTMIMGTIYMVILTLVIAVPISILSAIYLNEYATENKVSALLRFAIDGLVSVPSIVYGLFGFSLFVSTLNEYTGGYSILSGSLTLSIMILPILIKTIEEALITIPNELREASYGVGASKVQTIFRIVLPSCMPSIVTAIILGMGRIVSESAPVLLTAGMVYRMPNSIFDSSRTLTTHLFQLVNEGIGETANQQAFATASVLIIIVVILNVSAKMIANKLIRK